MPAPQNPIKTALGRGEMQIGLWVGFDYPVLGAIAADAGFDWCLIDMEHSPQDISALPTLLAAMERRQAALAVRVPSDDPVMLKRVLDLGIQTVLIPMVNTPEQAADVVRACRYPPRGIRGFGATTARAGGYGAVKDYTSNAEDELCILVQAESREALGNIEAIAAIDGIDGVFIGPSDLAADMGHLSNPYEPEVKPAIADGISRIVKTGKAACCLSFDPAHFGWYAELGVTFLAVGSDVLTYANGLRALATSAREAAS